MKKLNNLYKIRIEHNLSCKQMAHLLNISKVYYWQIENGDRRLYYELAIKIANIFKMKPDDIFLDDLKQT